MIKAIIIDDEAHVRVDIKKKIEQNFNHKIDITGEASDVDSAILIIEKEQPDLLFLDINLGQQTAFDILNQLTFKKFEIIFITGFDKHAIKAIKVGALDYILKPIDDDEFIAAVELAIEQNTQTTTLEKSIEVTNEYFNDNNTNKRIVLKTADTVFAIHEDDILYCKSEGNYTTFYTSITDKIIITKSAKKVEELLSEQKFVRCHQSYLVNKKHVIKYSKKGFLVLNNEIKIPVSSRRKEYTLEKIF
ncbi:LytR/AlgR family response regulator transcription factor [Tenacibaculum jejuense]|uniref:Two-component system response regulatory protein, LytTR family n=1 Tax=Tenacibaculum jejuense TaxID=584609 RepID=A0A238U8Y1_9FLAO|nr:LytTR family DNA-binding domain-containing protein [Tenacibaculum jejuense]SNR15627.1 Two-component system response regulatory protein, LytTR family [Tenacibaculum jejuense]